MLLPQYTMTCVWNSTSIKYQYINSDSLPFLTFRNSYLRDILQQATRLSRLKQLLLFDTILPRISFYKEQVTDLRANFIVCVFFMPFAVVLSFFGQLELVTGVHRRNGPEQVSVPVSVTSSKVPM